jgi:hypothetical protein
MRYVAGSRRGGVFLRRRRPMGPIDGNGLLVFAHFYGTHARAAGGEE